MGVFAHELNEVPTNIEQKLETEKALVKVDFNKFKISSGEDLKKFCEFCKNSFEELKTVFAKRI